MRDILSEIQETLKEIEEKEHVKILFAVESGSRSWGFASPDSDYDVRFIYARRPEDYLRLENTSDVIEWQLDEVLDINGWDVKKMLIHLKKGNATMFEWCNSPIVYKRTAEWEKVAKLAKNYFSKKTASYHYYGTAKSTYLQYLQQEKVKYKKYFYALRPLLSCNYIETVQSPPPVVFEKLLDLDMEEELRNAIQDLLEIKKVTQENELHEQMPVIINYIESELVRQKELIEEMVDDRNEDWSEVNRVFREVIGS